MANRARSRPQKSRLSTRSTTVLRAHRQRSLPDLAQQFFDNASENLWFIGTVGVLPHVGVVKNNFRNVPENAVSDWLQQTPGNTNIEQYFKRQA